MKHIFIAIGLSLSVFVIAASICEWYVKQLHNSGGIVLASEVLAAKYVPIILGIISFFAYASTVKNER